MFLGEPHITTKTFRQLTAKVGESFFLDTDKLEIYYASAVAAYQLDQMFATNRLGANYKPARYQIMLAARFIMDNEPLPHWNSKEMATRCDAMLEKLWDDAQAERIFNEAVLVADRAGGAGWDRDSIRLESVTKTIFESFSHRYRMRL